MEGVVDKNLEIKFVRGNYLIKIVSKSTDRSVMISLSKVCGCSCQDADGNEQPHLT